MKQLKKMKSLMKLSGNDCHLFKIMYCREKDNLLYRKNDELFLVKKEFDA